MFVRIQRRILAVLIRSELMDDLIQALLIFRKYGNPKNPTHCEHDQLFVAIDPTLVSEEDKAMLKKLSFTPEDDAFYSYRFGSC